MPKGSMRGDVSELPSWTQKQEGGDDDVNKGSQSENLEGEEAGVVYQRRPSVRDLASKFEKGQASAAKVAPEVAKANVTNQPDNEPQFQKIRRVLTEIRGRVAGHNKHDVEEALKAVEALEVIHMQLETELAHERGEVKNLAARVQQVSDDAKAIVEDTRAVAQAEIESAKETVAKVQGALQEQEQGWTTTEKRELEELKRESHEARRIKMLHESSKVMEMEHQIYSLRQQLVEKAAETAKLRKEVEVFKEQRSEVGNHQWYQLTGNVHLGTTLSIGPVDGEVLDLSHCTIQWYQITDSRASVLISGAIRPQYAPEPFDVGKILCAEINLPSGKTQAVQTSGPIGPARGLDEYVETLVGKGSAQFNVRIVLKNGETVEKQSLHTFDVNKSRIKLHKAHTVKAREIYSSSMQLCGARGGGDSAAQGLFWVAKKGQTFMLVLESERERNAAILLARKFAELHKIRLAGPGDVTPQED